MRAGVRLAVCLAFLGAPAGGLAQEAPAPAADTATAATSVAASRPPSRDELRRQRENAEVIRLAEEETGTLAVPGTEHPSDEGRSLGGAVLQMIIVLAGVSLLAYLLLGKLLPKIMRVPSPTGRPRLMRIVDRLPIDQRRAMLIVAIGEEYFLIGASEGGLELISRLDADTVRSADVSAGAEKGGLGRFAEAFGARNSKET